MCSQSSLRNSSSNIPNSSSTCWWTRGPFSCCCSPALAIHRSRAIQQRQQRDSRRRNRFSVPNRSVETPTDDGLEFQRLCRLFGPASQHAVASTPLPTQQRLRKRQSHTSPAEGAEAAQKRAGSSSSSDGHFRLSGADSVPSAATAAAADPSQPIGARAFSVHRIGVDPVRQPLLPPSQLPGQQTSF